MTEVRRATRDDLPDVTATLARAFVDDPVFRFLIPLDDDRHRSELAFRMLGINALDRGMVLRTSDTSAAAFWALPGQWTVPWRNVLRTLPLSLRAYRTGVFRALSLLGRIEGVHPREPHYYLEVLGTDPVQQGRGHGAAIMEYVLTRADAESVGAYLESSKDSNVPYYRRFGFEVVNEIRIPNGPTIWPMWRAPR